MLQRALVLLAAAALRVGVAAAVGAAPRAAAGAIAAPPAFTCARPVDLVFLIDESGSVTNPQFEILRTFMIDLLSAFQLDSADVVVGALGFAGSAYPHFTLGEVKGAAATAQAIRDIQRGRGSTRTDLGINAAVAELAARGRPPTRGASHLIILLTDGVSDDRGNPNAVVQAARDARAAGATISVVTINFEITDPSRAYTELLAQVNGDLGLWFQVDDWAGLEPGSPLVPALSRAACAAPVVPDDVNANVTTPLACNATVFLTYAPQLSSPLALFVEVTGGPVTLCYSYANRRPLPSDALSAPGAPANTTCTELAPRAPSEARAEALATFPSVSNPGGIDDPLLELHVSVTARNGSDGVCGGSANITAQYCAAAYAAAVVPVPGPGSDAPAPAISQLGTPGAPACAGCPAGGVLLGPRYPGVCGSRCLGAAQYAAPPPAGAPPAPPVCINCHETCAACAPPAAGAPPPRACTACAAPGAGWLSGAADPAQTSPFWAAAAPRLPAPLAPAAPPSAAAGRCLPGGCPAGFSRSAAGGCAATPAAAAADWSAALLTLCVPRAAGVPPPPPGRNSTLERCADFAADARAPALATRLAGALGVPPAALFLRSCLDVRERRRYVWTYQLQGAADALPFDEPDAADAVANATRRAASNCSCDAFVTFGLALGAAAPGGLNSSADFAAALTVLTSNATELAARGAAALALAAASAANAPPGMPLEPLDLAAQLALARARAPRALSAPPSQGYPPLVCDASHARLLGACLDAFPITAPISAFTVGSANIITFCGARPPPEGPSSTALPVAAAAGIAAGAVALLALLALGAVAWSRVYAQRLVLIKAHKARLARVRRRAAAADGDGGGLDDGEAEDGAGGGAGAAPAPGASRASFRPVNLDKMGGASAGGFEFAPAADAAAGDLKGAGSAAGDWKGAGSAVSDWAPAAVATVNPLAARGAASAAGAAAASPQEALESARRGAAARSAPAPAAADAWAAVPPEAMTRAQRALEWALPGAVSLGLGWRGAEVPISHDLGHERGPRAPAAYLAHAAVNVTMTSVGGVRVARAAGAPARDRVALPPREEPLFLCAE